MSKFAQKSIQIIASGLIALSLSASAAAADKTLYERLVGRRRTLHRLPAGGRGRPLRRQH